MKIPTKLQLEAARAKYPRGARVELPSGMDDPNSPLPAGTQGTVVGVDDMLNLMVRWDNGSSLNAIIGHDDIRKVSAVGETVKSQILAVRDTAKTNMFDTNAVQRIAFDLGYYELVDFIETDRKAYANFILTGE
jgi:hypothetical protein